MNEEIESEREGDDRFAFMTRNLKPLCCRLSLSLSRRIESRESTTITWHNSVFCDRIQCVFATLNKPLETCRAFIPRKFIKQRAIELFPEFDTSLRSFVKISMFENHDFVNFNSFMLSFTLREYNLFISKMKITNARYI